MAKAEIDGKARAGKLAAGHPEMPDTETEAGKSSPGSRGALPIADGIKSRR